MYFFAIDAGGSKTEIAVGDENSVLAHETGPSCKLARVGAAAAEDNLRDLVFRSLSHAGLTARQIAGVCVGMSGISDPAARQWMHEAMADLFDCNAAIVGDQEIAHYAAFVDTPGVLIIAGTGSIAVGRSPAGEFTRCGGWGPHLSDEGSACWIGELAVRKCVRLRDRRTETPLLSKLLKAAGVPLEKLVTTQSQFDFATLFPTIVDAAHEGDLTAWYVLSEAGRELADLALGVSEALHLVRGTVCGAGSVFRHAALVRSAFRGALAANAAHLLYDERLVEPVLGALAMARKAGA